jgi:hypothetical protein
VSELATTHARGENRHTLKVVAALLLLAQVIGLASEPSLKGALGLTISGSFLLVGALIGTRRPEHPIGRLFVAFGSLMAVNFASHAYAISDLPGHVLALWAGAHVTHVAFVFLILALLLFPDGRLPSPGWRWVARVTVLTAAGVVLSGIFEADYQHESSGLPYEPPVPAVADAASGLFLLLLVINVLLVVAAAASLLVRLRGARGEERQQLKWFVATVVFVAVVFVALLLALDEAYGFYLFGLIPVAAAVAILKYRLYDIDVVIKRTLIYATLTAVLAGAYVGGVLLLQLVLSPSSDLAIAGSTLAVAALFRPARNRIQQLVDRRFYRSAYDAQRTAEAFGTRLRDQLELDALTIELKSVVTETMHPTHVTVWLRSSASRGRS